MNIVETAIVRPAMGIVRTRRGGWRDIASGPFIRKSDFFKAFERHTLRVQYSMTIPSDDPAESAENTR